MLMDLFIYSNERLVCFLPPLICLMVFWYEYTKDKIKRVRSYLKAMRTAINNEEVIEGRERLLLSASVSAEAVGVPLFSPRELAVYVFKGMHSFS